MLKKIGIYVLGTLLFITSCSTDFDTTAEWKEIFVVYALINPADVAHYIRIEKAYLDATSKLNNIDLAAYHDSIYYKPGEITVTLTELNESGATVGAPINFDYVEGEDFGFPKDSGLFAYEPNVLYRSTEKLKFRTRYRLNIRNNITDSYVQGETITVDTITSSRPQTPNPNASSITDRNRTFLTVRNASDNPLSDEFITWDIPENGELYDVVLRMYYDEWNVLDAGTVSSKYLDWLIVNNVTNQATASSQIRQTLTPKSFLRILDTRLERNDNIRRKLRSVNPVEYYFYVGGLEYANYINSIKAQSGLTQNEANRPYTNLQSNTEAIGLFSSRSLSTAKNLQVESFVIDSLACSSITKGLNFALSTGAFSCP